MGDLDKLRDKVNEVIEDLRKLELTDEDKKTLVKKIVGSVKTAFPVNEKPAAVPVPGTVQENEVAAAVGKIINAAGNDLNSLLSDLTALVNKVENTHIRQLNQLYKSLLYIKFQYDVVSIFPIAIEWVDKTLFESIPELSARKTYIDEKLKDIKEYRKAMEALSAPRKLQTLIDDYGEQIARDIMEAVVIMPTGEQRQQFIQNTLPDILKHLGFKYKLQIDLIDELGKQTGGSPASGPSEPDWEGLSSMSPKDRTKVLAKAIDERKGIWQDFKASFANALKAFESFQSWLKNADPNGAAAFEKSYDEKWLKQFSDLTAAAGQLGELKDFLLKVVEAEPGMPEDKRKILNNEIATAFAAPKGGDDGIKDKDIKGLAQLLAAEVKSIYESAKALMASTKAAMTPTQNISLNIHPGAQQNLEAKPLELKGEALNKFNASITTFLGKVKTFNIFTVSDDKTVSADKTDSADKKVLQQHENDLSKTITSAHFEPIDNAFDKVSRDIKLLSSPALAMAGEAMGNDNLFAKILNEYLQTKESEPGKEQFARAKLVESLNGNKLVPSDVLKATRMDKVVLVFVTLFIRLFALSLIEFLIEQNKVRTVPAAVFGFLGLYTIVFVAFVMVVNLDVYRLRIAFNLLNMHANKGYVYMHLGVLWLVGVFIYLVIANLNAFGTNENPQVQTEYEKQVLITKLQVLTMIVWAVLVIIIALM